MSPEWFGPPGRLDVVSGLALAAFMTAATALTVSFGPAQPDLRALGTAGYLLVALGGAVLAFRNAAPTVTFAIALVLGLVYQAAGYPGGPAPLPIVVALYNLAARGYRLRALGLGLAATVLLVGVRGVSVAHGFESPLAAAFPTAVVAALYAGQLVANRRTARRMAAERAAEAERARELDTQRRIDAERLRIARELHDVVAHNISLINVQATMGVHLMDERPAEAAAALTAIKQASRQALGELRRILDVLRQADEAEPTAPAPGLAGLDAMVHSTGRAGLATRLTVLGTPRQLPSTVDVAAFRIIQESLTNALRYAGSAQTQVTLHYQAASLAVEIVDDGRSEVASAPAGSGHGIAGMRERAAAVGGTLHAGPVNGGGFAVRADLPLAAG